MASDFGSTRVDRSLLVRASRDARPPSPPRATLGDDFPRGVPTLPPLLTHRHASPSPLPQDDAFEGYRLSKDLLPDDACETFAIDPPALDAAPASASTDRVAQLASARRNRASRNQ